MSYYNSPRKHRSRLATPVRLGVVAVAACFIASPVLSNPVNPTVVNGAATFNQVGNVLTVTNSNGAIINWDKFSIKVGETTHFAQTAASSTVLNRVLNDPTVIYGTLSSNGRVWLVNPAGIMVGAGGRVDVAGFVASTLGISNENFLAGRNLFVNDGTGKDVVNQGQITTPAGGSVYLIGANVSNESVAGVANTGIITTPNGETILAAGATVSLIDSALPGVKVDITGAEGNATNLGAIAAEAGRIGIAGVIVRNSGTLNASSVVNEGGRIFLKASKDAYVDGNGRIVTTGTKGGQVEVLGERVAVMDNAEIDASGANGGGRIMIGGDYQGKNPDIQNATISYFGPDASLKADATEVGAGGTVVIWSDDTTRAYGNISARGGASGGNGGFVETSGKRYLDTPGIRVDVGASNGKGGLWLLDPSDISIVATGATDTAYAGGVFSYGGAVGTLVDDDINAALVGGSVTIHTDGVGVGGGNITTATGVSIYGGVASNSLTLAAYGGAGATGNITIAGSTINVAGGVNMLAGWDGAGFTSGDVIGYTGIDDKATIRISGSTVQSSGGAVNLWAGKDILLSNSGNTGTWIQGATMNVWAGHDLKLTGGGGTADFGPLGPGVMLKSAGTQTIAAGNEILLQAGSADNTNPAYGGNNMSGGGVGIWSDADQTISANVIKLYAGDSGHDNGAQIQAYGSQWINITGTGGLLAVYGGGTTGSYNNQARIQHGTTSDGITYTGTGGQNITIAGSSGDVIVRAGSGTGTQGYYSNECATATSNPELCRGSSNSATIENGVGSQTLNSYGYRSITVTGGSAGTNNWAGINNKGAGQYIYGNPDITLTGGTGGGAVSYGGQIFLLSNDAGISSKGTGAQTIYARSITINGGGNATSYGGAGIGNENGQSLYIATTGDLSMYGGASSAGDMFAGGVYIGNRNSGPVDLQIGGNLYIKSGSGNSAPVLIGSVQGLGDVSIVTGGNVDLIADKSSVAIGSQSTSYGATVTINSGGSLTLADSATSGVMIGSLFDQDSYTQVTLTAQKDITIGSATGDGVLIGVKNPSGNSSSWVDIVAGADSYRNTSTYGGNLLLDKSAAIDVGYGGEISLAALQATADNGNIRQEADSTIYGGNVSFFAEGNATFYGSVTASTGDINGSAGLVRACWEGGCYASYPSTYGGSLRFESTSIVSASSGIVLESSKDITINGQMASTNGDISIVAGGYRHDPSYSLGYSSSEFGGDVSIGGNIRAYGGSVNISANVGYYSSDKGNVTQTSGSIIGYNDANIVAGGSVSLSGTAEATTGSLSVRAGYQTGYFGYNGGYAYGVTPNGGDIVQHSGTLAGYNGVNLTASAGYASLSNGNIVQYGGSISSINSNIGIYADGNVKLNGRVETPNYLYIYAGLNSYQSEDADPYYNSYYGGNIELGASSQVYGGHVELIANRGTDDDTTGNITQEVGGELHATFNQSIADPLYAYAAGNVELLGTIIVEGGKSVEIEAGLNYPGETSQYFPDKHITINSLSAYGSSVELFATGPIIASTQDVYSITAGISNNSSSGGIEITNTGTTQPNSVNLSDNATANSAVTFRHSGSDLTLSNGNHSFSTDDGAGSIFVAAPSDNLTYYGGDLNGGSIILAAGKDLNMSYLSRPSADLGLIAGSVLNINSYSYVVGNNVTLVASTIKTNFSSVYAGNDLTMIAGNINADGGEGFHAGHNLTGIVADNITLDYYGYFRAGNDVDLTLKGAGSTLSMSNGGKVVAGVPTTIHLKFPARTSGGVETDGSSGSGLFVVVDGVEVPATAGNGLDLAYAPVVVTAAIDPCVSNPTLCKTVEPDKTPTDSDTPPPSDTTKTDPTRPPVDLSKTTGGTEGTFGDETGGTGGSDLDLLVSSAPPAAGDAEKKDEKKDEKDKKDKKSDVAKDEKKDEKTAAKKVAQCS